MSDPRTLRTIPRLVRTPDEISRRTLTPRRKPDPIWVTPRGADLALLVIVIAGAVLAVAVGLRGGS